MPPPPRPPWWNAAIHDTHVLYVAGPRVFCNVCGCSAASARFMGLAEPCLHRATSDRQADALRRLRRGLHPTQTGWLGEPEALRGRRRSRSRR